MDNKVNQVLKEKLEHLGYQAKGVSKVSLVKEAYLDRPVITSNQNAFISFSFFVKGLQGFTGPPGQSGPTGQKGSSGAPGAKGQIIIR